MAEYLKDPQATLGYAIDWTANYLMDDSISASTWSVHPVEDGGLMASDEALSGNIASAKFSGGISGHVYRVSNSITLVSGQSDERQLTIRIGDR